MKKQASDKPRTIYLRDYLPPDYRIEAADLHFDLRESRVIVKSLLTVSCVHERDAGLRPFVLQGEKLKLRSLKLDGLPLTGKDYLLNDESLTILPASERFLLEIETECNPSTNTELTGLYRSGGMFLTQCEAEGFRRITFYPDRPDVLASFSTTIVADRKKYPQLLSNGNLVASGGLDRGRHFVRWHDPFPKPAYLFALVAGDLACIEDDFITLTSRKVKLQIYVQHHNRDKCSQAMDSLKKAMKWDEETYGREYDLDRFMIVATDDFNMGAMENKGLNIFNSKYVLADWETATDDDLNNIMGVVAHEYFHNWSGNRVTCRDWFQLSLKEGFTVFRDQHFMADMTSPGVRRIGEVNLLRAHQFIEDGGPLAHPVRPESYVEINNFYTATVYNKGAEIIRMLLMILGQHGFRKGTDLYFLRHDGQAVTTDDFLRALEDASGVDLGQFRRWYSQAGTPVLQIRRAYDRIAKTYALTIKQICPHTPDQQSKELFHLPVVIGLLACDGGEIPLQLSGEEKATGTTLVLQLKKEEERFLFLNVPHEPVPSVLRGFSAPVKLDIDLTDDERLFLMAHDSDAFNRWDAGQQLALRFILPLVRDYQQGRPLLLADKFVDAFRETLTSTLQDKAFQALALKLPSEKYLADNLDLIDPDALHTARRFVLQTLAEQLKDQFLALYHANQDYGNYRFDQEGIGRRSLRNTCLNYLMELEGQELRDLCLHQFRTAGNMTDVLASLENLANTAGPEREETLALFYDKWREDPLVMDKWLAIQAASRLPDTLQKVKALTGHPAFTLRNPNKVRALIGTFTANLIRFHDASGAGYSFLTEQVLAIDPLNPQIAARLATSFAVWKRYEEKRQGLMKVELERILDTPKLSRDLYEIASKSLF